jgi:hypothetical protein
MTASRNIEQLALLFQRPGPIHHGEPVNILSPNKQIDIIAALT